MACEFFPPTKRRSDRRPPICVASITLPRSPVSLSSGDEVPHIFTRKSRLQPGEFLISSAKRLLQQYRHEAADRGSATSRQILRVEQTCHGRRGTAESDPAKVGPKRLELLHELVPTATVVGLLVNPTNPNVAEPTTKNLHAAARAFGLEVHVLHASADRDFDTVFATLVQLRAGALVIGPDPF